MNLHDETLLLQIRDAFADDPFPPAWPLAHMKALVNVVLDQEDRLMQLEGRKFDLPRSEL